MGVDHGDRDFQLGANRVVNRLPSSLNEKRRLKLDWWRREASG
jgi:hypothetical protein